MPVYILVKKKVPLKGQTIVLILGTSIYVETGIEFYELKQKEQQLKYLTKKANELNLQLVSY